MSLFVNETLECQPYFKILFAKTMPLFYKQEGHDGPGSLTKVSLEPNYFKIFIPVKLFQKLSTDVAEEVVKSLFLFITLAAILFNLAESFEQFW